jgi:hypothetical protein
VSVAYEVPPLYTTIYITQYRTMYMLITNYWVRYPDGTRVLKRSVTRLLSPEEYAELEKEEEELVKKAGTSQAPRSEEELGVVV